VVGALAHLLGEGPAVLPFVPDMRPAYADEPFAAIA
jgi:hypothetical protein